MSRSRCSTWEMQKDCQRQRRITMRHSAAVTLWCTEDPCGHSAAATAHTGAAAAPGCPAVRLAIRLRRARFVVSVRYSSGRPVRGEQGAWFAACCCSIQAAAHGRQKGKLSAESMQLAEKKAALSVSQSTHPPTRNGGALKGVSASRHKRVNHHLQNEGAEQLLRQVGARSSAGGRAAGRRGGGKRSLRLHGLLLLRRCWRWWCCRRRAGRRRVVHGSRWRPLLPQQLLKLCLGVWLCISFWHAPAAANRCQLLAGHITVVRHTLPRLAACLSVAPNVAPCLRSACTHGVLPLSAAQCSAVQPLLSAASTQAPRSSSARRQAA